jgi:hypothetical protein
VSQARSSYIIDPFDTLAPSHDQYETPNSADSYAELSLTQQQGRAGENVLQVTYNVVQSETWGGFASFGILHQGTNYINCAGADTISFDIFINVTQSSPQRAHLRLSLEDEATAAGNEVYYAFHYVLDDAPGWRTISVPLQGDNQESSPFWRTGWLGVEGNAH